MKEAVDTNHNKLSDFYEAAKIGKALGWTCLCRVKRICRTLGIKADYKDGTINLVT